MIIATFREGTSAAGRVIESDDGVMRVVGGPSLSLQELWYYDQAGQLEWAQDGLREATLGSFRPATPALRPAPRPHSKYLAPLVIGGVVVALLAVVGIVVAMVVPTVVDQRDLSKRSGVREGVTAIELGLQSWSVDNGDLLPDPSLVNAQGLAGHMDQWPMNPYTKQPMRRGSGAGDFSYVVDGDHRHFTLTGYGRDGEVVVVVP